MQAFGIAMQTRTHMQPTCRMQEQCYDVHQSGTPCPAPYCIEYAGPIYALVFWVMYQRGILCALKQQGDHAADELRGMRSHGKLWSMTLPCRPFQPFPCPCHRSQQLCRRFVHAHHDEWASCCD